MTRLSLDIFVPSSVQSHAERTRGFLGFPYAWYSIWSQDQCEKWGQANSLLHAHKARSRLPGTRIVFPRQELEKVLPWDDHFNGITSCTYSNFWPLKAISEHLTFSWESMLPHSLNFACVGMHLFINTWSYQSKIAASGCAKWDIIVYIFCSAQQLLSYVHIYVWNY